MKMQIEIVPTTGQLVYILGPLSFYTRSCDEPQQMGRLGNGREGIFPKSMAFPHDAMCGVFSRDDRIRNEALSHSSPKAFALGTIADYLPDSFYSHP